ncbi:MAG: hypothetical protein ACTSUD_00630 [Alphaproteobacteria bacterium]
MQLRLRSSDFWILALLCVGLQAVFVLGGISPLRGGGLFGPDSYMRVNRVLHLLGDGAWYSSIYPRSNAPFGEVLHWTRAFDTLLLALGGLAAPFVGFKPAIFWSGAVVSPLLQIATLFAFLWAMRPVLDPRSRFYLGLLFLLQPAVLVNFIAGRVDHHSLILLLFVLSMGLGVRLLIRPYRFSTCIGAGAVAALALWVSVEALAAIFLTLLALGAFWVFAREDFARKAIVFSLAMLAGAAIAMMLERPLGQMLAVEFDRISVVSMALLAINAALWGVIFAADRRAMSKARARLVLLSLGALAAAAVLWLALPKIFLGPMVDMHPGIKAIWFDYIKEAKPILSLEHFSPGRVVFWLGLVLPAMPFLGWLALRDGEPARRRVMIYLFMGAALFLPIALSQLRAAAYPVLLVLPAFAVMLTRLLARVEGGAVGPLRPLRAGAGGLAILGFLALPPALGLALPGEATPSAGAKVSCKLPGMARFLADPKGRGGRQTTLLAAADFGPELLYRTPHRVIATPYHRNSAGILAAHEILVAAGDEQARAGLRARGVGLILLCPGGLHEAAFADTRSADTFYRRLVRGRTPAWLREVPLSDNLGARFRLFELIR